MNRDFLRLTTIPLSHDLHNSAHKAIKTIGRGMRSKASSSRRYHMHLV